ncbi:hypothetical protein RND71_021895 [Anisodus tanguticus]|uniref:Vacuolar fusion protein MON1 homolog n=1 Tax=Anisodus tanguticus TaxID=243964 RepID=A0AAE1VDD5_9SOLA|nr:hypothetical protein RND71_021895 [Anisodus tanguticus]
METNTSLLDSLPLCKPSYHLLENGGDRVNLVRAGKHQVVFLVKGPIYLVCISCTEESYMSLRGQLELLYNQMVSVPHVYVAMYIQMILILTRSVYRCFEKNAKFDMTPLLGATDVVFSSLIHSFSWTSESFSPICLPRFNPMAFLYAYVHYLDVDTYLICRLQAQMPFIILKIAGKTYNVTCRIRVENVLLKSNVLGEVQRSMVDGGMRIEDLPDDHGSRSGAVSPHLGQPGRAMDSSERLDEAFLGVGGLAGLWHFIYRSIYLDQYVSSELYRAYQKIYASMHDNGIGPHKTQFRRDENYGMFFFLQLFHAIGVAHEA